MSSKQPQQSSKHAAAAGSSSPSSAAVVVGGLPKPTFHLVEDEARADPVVRSLCVRQEMWKYYPRLIYDMSLPQLARGIWWTATQRESPEAQEAIRMEVARAVAPKEPSAVICALSLRSFFDALLRAMNLPRGSEIIWSGVSIPQMFQIAEYHHLRARAFDIDLPTFTPDLAAAEKCFTPATKLLVLAPVFGRPMRHIKELIAMAKARGVPVMLDCAQTFLLRDEMLAYEGADIVAFSFGSIKYSTAINGSVAVVRDPVLCEKVKAAERELQPRPFATQAATVAKNGVIMLSDDAVSFGILRNILEATGGHIGELTNAMSRGFPGAELIRQIRFRPRASNLRLMLHRMRNHDAAAQLLRTISGWDFLSQMPPYIQIASGGCPDEPQRSTFWLFPMHCRCPAVVSDILQAQGFDAALGTSQMRATGDSVTTPQCSAFMERVLYIPVYPEMSEEARARFIAVMNKVPRRYIESPSKRFHAYVASRAEKHAYRSKEVTQLLTGRPKFSDTPSALIGLLAGAAAVPLLCAKL